jgi:hypothetical protein
MSDDYSRWRSTERQVLSAESLRESMLGGLLKARVTCTEFIFYLMFINSRVIRNPSWIQFVIAIQAIYPIHYPRTPVYEPSSSISRMFIVIRNPNFKVPLTRIPPNSLTKSACRGQWSRSRRTFGPAGHLALLPFLLSLPFQLHFSFEKGFGSPSTGFSLGLRSQATAILGIPFG